MSGITWEEPPAEALRRATSGRYESFAKVLASNPGKWAVLPGERTDATNRGTAQNIRAGRSKGFSPKGAYEATTDGTKVWVRYVGEGVAAPETPEKDLADSTDAPAIRLWAKSQGMEVPERGRLAAALVEAYHARPV